ncbi:MAG: SDR family NAD(P)-dependent oxidoreductase [Gammaproteobacteria bacterium]|nr:SDR family NAD(P)-dependent oxidoreductase [Gammaproteobacteria bacterium]MDH5801634.1 SDR family NAD(P)-dependent oxidoreductase [Gammaproteobacteria bacterium]
MNTGKRVDVAVIGMSCRFPGADNYEQYWDNLSNGVCSIDEVPADRWDWKKYFGDPNKEENKTNSKWGGFLPEIDRFDAQFFGVSPREAVWMDPQQRLLMELTWQCIEDAGYLPKELAGKNVGVFLGVGGFDYQELQNRHCSVLEGHRATGVFNSILANRLSYYFNFHGPSIPVDTACSGSLVALHLAANAIANDECESALVGGIGLFMTPSNFISFAQMGMLSPTGQCKTFDDAADGYVRGEGCGLIFLKPLNSALKDGDDILGVIKGSAINHGGRAKSITAPNAMSQSKVITAAFKSAGFEPHTVNYIEAHGTGTPLGDPIEIHGLTRAFRQLSKSYKQKPNNQSCGLGAVKTNIGHLEPAAGIAGVIKVLLAMKNKMLPANANFDKINSRINLENTPFYVMDRNRQWLPVKDSSGEQYPLRAGVSSFGYGGVNGHVLLEQSPLQISSKTTGRRSDNNQSEGMGLLCMSAKNPDSLQKLAESYRNKLSLENISTMDLCYSANTKRTHMDRKIAVLAGKNSEYAAAISAFLNGTSNENLISASGIRNGKLGFLFTGQGAQLPQMGKTLYRNYPVFRQAVDMCDSILHKLMNESIRERMFAKDGASLSLTQYTQPALFTYEYAMVQLWTSLGVKPEVLLGHSIGEFVAACVSGVISLEDALKLVAKRGELMGRLPSDGGMLAVMTSAEQVEKISDGNLWGLDVAAINADDSIVLSGAMAQVQQAKVALSELGVESRQLEVSQAFHSGLIEPMLDEFRVVLESVQFNDPKIKIISNLSGEEAGQNMCTVSYWLDHIRKPVLYAAGIKSAFASGVHTFIEVGPQPILSGLTLRNAGPDNSKTVCIPSAGKSTDENAAFLRAVATAYVEECSPDLSKLNYGPSVKSIKLPLYPFSGNRYWIDLGAKNSILDSGAGLSHTNQDDARLPVLGRHVELARPRKSEYFYESLLPDDMGAYLLDHKVEGQSVMPAAGYICQCLAAAAESGLVPEGESVNLREIKFHKPMIFDGNSLRSQIIVEQSDTDALYHIHIYSKVKDEPSWTEFASATLAHTNEINFSAVKESQKFSEIQDLESYYQKLREIGLQYGNDFRSLKSLSVGNRLATAELSIPDGVSALGPRKLNLHPVILDGAFQMLAALVNLEDHPGKIPLPVEMEALQVFSDCPDRVQAQLQLRENSRGDHNSYHADITLRDMKGRIIAQAGGLKVMWVEKQAISSSKDLLLNSCFTPKWRAIPTPLQSESNVLADSVCFYTPQAEPLMDFLEGDDTFGVLVRLANNNKKISRNHWEVDSSSSTAIVDLLTRIPQSQNLFYLSSPQVDVDSNDIVVKRTGKALIDRELKPLFHLLKELANTRSDQSMKLHMLSANSCAVLQGETGNPLVSAQWGLIRSVCNEIGSWQATNLDIDITAAKNGTAKVVRESVRRTYPGFPLGLAIRNGEFYARELVLAKTDVNSNSLTKTGLNPSPYKDEGVYVIAGAGGIGLELAKTIVSDVSARVILLGRSPMNVEMEQVLLGINDQNRKKRGEIHYLQGDITNLSSLQAAVSQISERFGPITGAVHSAAVVQDKSIVNMTEDMLDKVLLPKVLGSENLALALKDQPLDFILFFSSAMSLLASSGQANYIAANAYMDAFSQALEQQTGASVRTINWGFWGEIGVAADKFYHERFASQGVYPLSTAEGMEAIRRCLLGQTQQIAVVKATANVLQQMGVNEPGLSAQIALSVSEAESAEQALLDLPDVESLAHLSNDELSVEVLYGISRIIGDVMRVDVRSEFGDIPQLLEVRLTSLGIDSLTTVDLRNRVRAWLGVEIPAELLIGGGRISEVVELINQKLLLQRISRTASVNNDEKEEAEVFVL